MQKDLTNFEKIVVGFLLVIVICSILYKYVFSNTVNGEMISLTGLLLASFTVRKVASYFKPDTYNKATIRPVEHTISKEGDSRGTI